MTRKLRRLTIALATSAAVLLSTTLTADGIVSAERATQPVAAEPVPAVLQVPPPTGITLGFAGTTQPAEFAQAQAFAIESLSAFHVPTQRWRTFVPGAPTFANSLTPQNLNIDTIVFAKRTGATTLLSTPPPLAGPPVVPVPDSISLFTPPPTDGLTLGMAGTSDPFALAVRQLFKVQTINLWDVNAQRYRTYIPGAPTTVNTLTPNNLSPADIVWLKADGPPMGAVGLQGTPLIIGLVPPGSPNSLIEVGPPLFGTIVDNGDGSVTYIPAQGFSGEDVFSYTVQTPDGDVETHNFKVIILPVNSPPIAVDDVAIANPGGLTVLTVLDNDYDPDDDEIFVLGTTQPAHGIVTLNGNLVLYVSKPNYLGPDSFTYEISDGIAEPGDEDAIGTVTIDVGGKGGLFGGGGGGGGGGGTGPVAGPPPEDDGDGGGDGGADIPAEFLTNDELYIETCDGDVIIDVLANDAGDGVTELSVASVGAPTLGASANGGTSVTYTPPEDCTGNDSFTYTVLDTSEVDHTASVAVYLNQADPDAGGDGGGETGNQLPNALDDAASTFETTPVTIDLLDNDSDPDSDPISITAIGEPDFGALVDNGDGTVTYTAPTYYGGTVTFSYTITDGVSGESSATVTIVVERGAVSARLPIVVFSGGSVTVQVITPSDSVQLDSVTEGSHGTVSMNQAAGTFTYQPDSDFIGSDWISWTLLFSHGGTAETTVQIDVIN